MGEFWDAERGSKAAVWFGFYVVCYLLMGLSCEVGLPTNCTRASEPMEVLMELPLLLAFAIAQASAASIMWLETGPQSQTLPGKPKAVRGISCVPASDMRTFRCRENGQFLTQERCGRCRSWAGLGT